MKMEDLQYLFEDLDSILYDLEHISYGDVKKAEADMEWVKLKLIRLRQYIYEDYKTQEEMT